MGKIIPFPLMRRRPHVALVWDRAWDQYRVEAARARGPNLIEWHADYGIALDRLISMGALLGLPMIDCTPEGRARSC
ncbi:hypothetical protein [Sphingobium sp.]|uniref:hypothetical protein n=1 Tax=Sphingobium sp. TaxID=1912891 RepID=UPI00257FCC94|nr:hypothetical protein [Sphingobium sp.]MBR2267358.1 hypothetical protein [Sphingobium sp.]